MTMDTVFCYLLQDGLTPIMIASMMGHTNIVKALIEAHADVNIKDKVCTHTILCA